MKKNIYSFSIIFSLLLFVHTAFSQGSTSSSLSGKTIGTKGETLPGVSILAIYTPTGAKYGAVSNINGIFRINNMQVGGPYEVVASFIGFKKDTISNIYLTLGQNLNLIFTLKEENNTLSEVVVSSQGIFDKDKTGGATDISENTILSAPTVERNLVDLLRFEPSANVTNEGISFQGMNNRYNAIFIDGAVNNDVFGLANSGTNGGQAGISPISFDAIEQIAINVAPYDVTYGGFAGASVNAVTRSGTNELEGSTYWLHRNQGFTGLTPTDDPNIEKKRLEDFSVSTYGFRLGGPIIKNKLFFFTNVEIENRVIPKPFNISEYRGGSNAGTITSLINHVKNQYGYDPGDYRNITANTNGVKVLAKLNWDISQTHKLSLRHSYVSGIADVYDDEPGQSTIAFSKSGYTFPSITNSTALEWIANFDNMSNKLILGVTIVRDDRDILGSPFPRLRIRDNGGTIYLGTDNFSYSNIVFQDVYTLTNNLTFYKNKHTITIGTHNEFFKIQNLFTIFSTPRYTYNSVADFLAGNNGSVAFGHELPVPGQSIRLGDKAENLGPTFTALQVAFYVQDEFNVSDRFKLTAGLRFDIPIYLEDAPLDNTDFNNNTIPEISKFYDIKGARASKLPSTSIMINPRVGFNYDVTGDSKYQLRGGMGLFTSRIPWVWPGGVYIRNGLNSGANFGSSRFYSKPEEWVQNLANTTRPSGDVDIFAENFKYPQVLRASIALDARLPGDILGTFETTFTKNLNNILVKNVNVKPATETLEGADRRNVYTGSRIDSKYNNITFVDNTSEGYTFNLTLSLQKSFASGLSANVSYSYTDAMAIFDGTSFINGMQWQNLHTVEGRNADIPLSVSDFAGGHRITAFLSYRKQYAKNFATTVSLFFNGQSGRPFSFTYNDGGNLTGEGVEPRSLIYVPANSSEIVFEDNQASQWAALDAYISNNEYLNSRRGQYVERNGSRTPFEAIFDIKVAQDFILTTGSGKKHTLQVTFDLFNVANFLNSDWGRRYFVDGATFELLNFKGYQDNTKIPTFSFTQKGDPWNIRQGVSDGGRSARWTAQIGARYSF